MPWSPTARFPYPLAAMTKLTIGLIHLLKCQGLGDVINNFRARILGLDPISKIWAPGFVSRLLTGYCFLKQNPHYDSSPDLKAFLESGPIPIYIGLCSIVVDKAEELTANLLEEIKWGAKGLFLIGDVPDECLFDHVSCVLHHRGDGTTAAGLVHGKPTVIMPFFGDQSFWERLVARIGAGPCPVPIRQLMSMRLAEAIKFALKPETCLKAKQIAHGFENERGDENAAKAFHEYMDVDRLKCSLIPERAAMWNLEAEIRLSGLLLSL
ncbi:glycosyltransferase family 1 protein [Lepidopterella palustris CBS 459.81]|uniref:Glycosyltransferase family 1 protein n=1 Tax=Lepidopterella palustris CBS 459.81 TaxID=1314670 RepID=A0A8E2E0B5_9PEZI|nr:glycosyltransferase family 1 protein [Lepidopterella palustris CBS 459.81]